MKWECPEHHTPLKKERIVYGLPDPKLKPEEWDFIPGGCCPPPIADAPQWGYVCPADGEVFVVEDGKLVGWTDDETSQL